MEIFPETNSQLQLKCFSLILTNISDKKKIEEISITDSLSGLYNRNYFEMIFEKETKRSKRDLKALTLILLDIDLFKQYNDTYGHQEGDNAIKAIASVLIKHTNRSYDYAFRIGGEEFLILTYQDNFDNVEALSENIVKDVEELKISHHKSDVSKFVTVSIGSVQFTPSHPYSHDEMFKKADDLLYQSKSSGRNRFSSELVDYISVKKDISNA